MLLRQIQYPEDATADMFSKEIRTLEDGLKKLVVGEAKCAAELDDALKQYAELQEQAMELDPIELFEARQDIRSEHERDSAKRLQDAYGIKYDRAKMYDSKRSIANLLGEEAEERSLTSRLRAKQREQKQAQVRMSKRREQER